MDSTELLNAAIESPREPHLSENMAGVKCRSEPKLKTGTRITNPAFAYKCVICE